MQKLRGTGAVVAPEGPGDTQGAGVASGRGWRLLLRPTSGQGRASAHLLRSALQQVAGHRHPKAGIAMPGAELLPGLVGTCPLQEAALWTVTGLDQEQSSPSER